MKFLKSGLLCLLIVTLSGCSYFKPRSDTVPENFIVNQDTSQLRNDLNEFSPQSEHIINFDWGGIEISKSEQDKLLQWIVKTQPAMIAVRGTAGAQKYQDLGEQRGVSVVNYLKSAQTNIEIILLDYVAELTGRRVIVQSVPAKLALEIRQQAPILIIKPG